MNPTILIVDDDDALLHSMRRMLERSGYVVLEAGNIPEARATIDVATPDLVIMDLVLPGMEGREGANLIAAHCPGVRVLFISGFTSQESIRMGHLGSGEAFLRKPFSVDELLGEVERLLDSREQGGRMGA